MPEIKVGDKVPSPKEERTTMEILLKKFQEQEQKINEMQQQIDNQGKPKPEPKDYKWPRSYRYQMWGKRVVTDVVFYLEDETKDRVYRNEYNAEIDNSKVILFLFDLEKNEELQIRTLSVEYRKHVKKSDHTFPEYETLPKPAKDGTLVKFYGYKFGDKIVEVSDYVIN